MSKRFGQKPKKPNPSASDSNGFGECIFIDEECKSAADQPVPMFLEQTDAVADETDHTVYMSGKFKELYSICSSQ